MFDGMPKKQAAASGKDPFSDLTDDLLCHVISFLPGDDALQTCLLDTRWRDLRRRATMLDFTIDASSSSPSCERFRRLVKLIITLRGDLPLVTCRIRAYPDDEMKCGYASTLSLIEYALTTCQVKELLVCSPDDRCFPLPPKFDVPVMVSRWLKALGLQGVRLECSAADFSGCPVLEELMMRKCYICARKISSESLKLLCIADSCVLPDSYHVQISAPGLVNLELADFEGLTPFLENMPLLEEACVRLGDACLDFCHGDLEYCDYPSCGCHAYPRDEGVLLNGLSNAINLELIAAPPMFMYTWDVERCPMFGNLKSLLLNEWFTAIDLVCILQHSPVLEMLTLQLGNTENLVGATGAQETTRQSLVCVHLKVNIECSEVDVGVRKLLSILSACGIPREQISITTSQACSERFSFEDDTSEPEDDTSEPADRDVCSVGLKIM